jgi:hypothetical protein
MAKQQSFEDKIKKKSQLVGFKPVKLVYAVKSKKSGAWRFPNKFIHIPDGVNEEQYVSEQVAKLRQEFGR